MLRIHASQRRKQSGIQSSTANFIYNLNSVIQYFNSGNIFCRQALSVHYAVSSQHLSMSSFFFCNHTRTTTSHICSSVRAHSDAFAMFNEVLIKRPKYSISELVVLPGKSMQQSFSKSTPLYRTKQKEWHGYSRKLSLAKFLVPLYNLVSNILCHVYTSSFQLHHSKEAHLQVLGLL